MVLETKVGTVMRILVTLFFITVSMVFAQPSLENAFAVLKQMFIPAHGVRLPMDQNRLWWTVYLVVFAHLIVLSGAWLWLWKRIPGPVLGAGLRLDIRRLAGAVARYHPSVLLLRLLSRTWGDCNRLTFAVGPGRPLAMRWARWFCLTCCLLLTCTGSLAFATRSLT